MIITAIEHNITDQPDFPAGRRVIEVAFEDLDLDKRIQRVQVPGGGELGLRLNPGHPILRDGDVLTAADDAVHVVRIAPTDVLVITPTDAHEMGFVAHALGNRHLPAQFAAPGKLNERAAMVVAYDHTVQAFLDDHGVDYQRTELVPPKPFRHSEHTH